MQSCSLLFALIEVITFICKREIVGCSSPLTMLSFQASSVQTQLLEIEPEYKENLLNAVEVYKDAMVDFVDDYDAK